MGGGDKWHDEEVVGKAVAAAKDGAAQLYRLHSRVVLVGWALVAACCLNGTVVVMYSAWDPGVCCSLQAGD